MRQRIGAAVVAGIFAATSAWASPASAGRVPCRPTAMQHLRGDMRETVRARTFYIDAKPQAESFKIGTAAKIDITVTRPAHQDPFDLGLEYEPPTSMPAEDVLVGVGVHAGQVFVPGFARTNAEGKTTVSLRLPRYMVPGSASMSVYAWNVVHESPCLRVEEDGYRSYPEAFDVTR